MSRTSPCSGLPSSLRPLQPTTRERLLINRDHCGPTLLFPLLGGAVDARLATLELFVALLCRLLDGRLARTGNSRQRGVRETKSRQVMTYTISLTFSRMSFQSEKTVKGMSSRTQYWIRSWPFLANSKSVSRAADKSETPSPA